MALFSYNVKLKNATSLKEKYIYLIETRESQGVMSAIHNIPNNIIDGVIIAEMELKEKKIPFIIRRPIPNGGSEYWKVEDLEVLDA